MISERTLRKWRKEALESIEYLDKEYPSPIKEIMFRNYYESCKRVLKLTQALLDQHLLKK